MPVAVGAILCQGGPTYIRRGQGYFFLNSGLPTAIGPAKETLKHCCIPICHSAPGGHTAWQIPPAPAAPQPLPHTLNLKHKEFSGGEELIS